jgi:uncharacterized protein (TIGR00304 family)
VSLVLLVAGIALLAASIATGEGQIGLFLIFPFVVAWGPIAVLGALLFMLAMVCVFIGMWRQGDVFTEQTIDKMRSAQSPEKKFGGVIMIGPIPIAFGSDKKTANRMMWIGIAMFVVMLIIFLIFAHPFV